MKILHLFANWKWTGPAEPALHLAWQQAQEHDVRFASGAAPPGRTSLITPHVQERGVRVVEGLQLSKHARFRANREDIRGLIGLLDSFRPDIVHTHLDNDHRVASFAVARTGIGRLVRTAYDPAGLGAGLRTRRVARRALDGLILTLPSAWEQTLAAYGGAAHSLSVGGQPRPVVVIEGAVDLQRFDPGRFDRAAARRQLGLEPGQVAVGVVARVQGHRRFELLLEAFARVVPDHPELRLVVIGRGTHIRPLLLDPVRRMGLAGSVLSPGYLRGDDYPAALAALDATLFLVPGSDGTCRALREQMAMGLVPVVSTRPPLPDIVEEGTSGLVVDESVDGLEQAFRRVLAEPDMRQRLGRGARETAERRFDVRAQARAVTAFYGVVLGVPRAGRPVQDAV